MTPWTRLEGTQLWADVEAAMQQPAGRHYHNMNHIRQIYKHAALTFELPYDKSLDLAILAHDVIYDNMPNKELRSAEWLFDRIGDVQADKHILKTIDHAPTADNRMIILDLADFMDQLQTERNYEAILDESLALYGCTRVEFFEANITALDRILRNMIKLQSDPAAGGREIRAAAEISYGIEWTIMRSENLLELELRG